MNGTLYIVSAPSGAGKTSLVKALIAELDNLEVSISHTTRPMRQGEKDGVNYHFVDSDAFQELQASAEFIECAEVFGNYYGTSKSWVINQLNKGVDIILEIDWQGAEQVRKSFPNAQGIFILPPSIKSLQERLNNRGQDDQAVINKRLKEAQAEISHYPEYDYIVVNDDFERAKQELIFIVESRRLTQEFQSKKLLPLLSELLN